MISDDQLLVLDNVLVDRINHVITHQAELEVPLQIDVLPCHVTVDYILEALMQLLPWVSKSTHAGVGVSDGGGPTCYTYHNSYLSTQNWHNYVFF